VGLPLGHAPEKILRVFADPFTREIVDEETLGVFSSGFNVIQFWAHDLDGSFSMSGCRRCRGRDLAGQGPRISSARAARLPMRLRIDSRLTGLSLDGMRLGLA
jgi:hypothetical protein